MAIITCRECGKDTSDEAASCPHCGISTPSEDKFIANKLALKEIIKEAKIEEWTGNAFKVGGGLLVLWFIFSGKAWEIFSDITQSFKDEVIAACKIEKVDVKPDIFVINGEADAGFLVNSLVNKTNSDGEVTITVRLSSTEGNLQKERTIFMKKDQRNWVQIQFSEPTINAQQVTATTGCRTI